MYWIQWMNDARALVQEVLPVLLVYLSFLLYFGPSRKDWWSNLSHCSAAESLSPKGSDNYSSSVLAAETRAIFRFPKMTSALIGTLTSQLLEIQHLGIMKTTSKTCLSPHHHQWQISGMVTTKRKLFSAMERKDGTEAKFSLCCWAWADAESEKLLFNES